MCRKELLFPDTWNPIKLGSSVFADNKYLKEVVLHGHKCIYNVGQDSYQDYMFQHCPNIEDVYDAGLYYDKVDLRGEFMSYWCKTLAKGYSNLGDTMEMSYDFWTDGENGAKWYYDGEYRWEGLSVRPVRKK